MTLSDLSIRRPVMAWMLMFGLIIFGGIAFTRMGVSQLPDVDYPVVSVNLTDQGAAPEVMETDIVDVVEDSLMSIQGVRTITSVSRDSGATVTVEFELNRNIDLAQQDVQSKLQAAQRYLPKEMDPVVITKTNPEDQPIVMLSLESETIPPQKLMAYVKDVLKDKFATVSGVGDISMMGYVDPNMRIWVSDRALNQYNLTVDDVINTVTREHYEPPAGFLQAGKKEFNVRLLGEASTKVEFENLIINQRGGMPNYTPIRLGQVARIEEGLNDVRRLSRGNGKSAVGLGIIKQRGTNEVEVAKAVKKRMAELQKTLPPGMTLAVNFDNTVFTEQAVGDMNFTLVLSAILTGIVCWMFLGSWSSTINVLLAIPTSIVGAFLILYFCGFTLNTFTLMALSLVIGIVVDDAIMMLENIMRHREMGQGRVEAATIGAREITFAAIATSLAIIAIFLPVAFMQGIMGKFFFQFGVTITVAVALSLLEAVTLTPMRCSQFLDVAERRSWFGKGMEKSLEWARKTYAILLKGALNHRWKVVVASLIFFAGSLFTVSKLNKEFLPPVDQSRFMIRMQTPVGSSLSYTDQQFKIAEQFLLKRPEVARTFVVVGSGNVVNMGFAYITLKPKGERGIDPQAGHELTQQEFMGVCRTIINKIPDIKAVGQDLSLRSFSASRGFPIEFTLKGPDWDGLAKYTDQLTAAMEKSGLMTDIDTDYKVGQPEMHVIPDRNQATIRGVSVVAIGEVINAMIGGVQVGTYPKSGHRYDVRVKLEDDNRPRNQRINSLFVRNNRGELIPLSEVVRIEEKKTLQSITRKDRERAISVFANVATGKSQQTALETVQQLAKQILPGDYHVVIVGSAQTFQESFRDLFMALILGILVAYMILASQYNSYIDPLTILMALPFSVSGAFIALLLAHQSLNIYSMIGLILLMGIVKKNSILLVDFTNKVRERGVASVHDALLEACPVRLRPILMTSIAIIAGAAPVALAIGPGAESRVPMAVAIIGGVLVSTILTLFVVPCVYSLLSKLESKKAHHLVLSETGEVLKTQESQELSDRHFGKTKKVIRKKMEIKAKG
jgi:HAE1 family hydrophobic/amphiphilic exporter-1